MKHDKACKKYENIVGSTLFYSIQRIDISASVPITAIVSTDLLVTDYFDDIYDSLSFMNANDILYNADLAEWEGEYVYNFENEEFLDKLLNEVIHDVSKCDGNVFEYIVKEQKFLYKNLIKRRRYCCGWWRCNVQKHLQPECKTRRKRGW